MYFLLVPIFITTYKIQNLKLLLNILVYSTILSALMTIILHYFNFDLHLEFQLSKISPFINHMYYGSILAFIMLHILININFNEKLYLFIIKIFSIFIILLAMSYICNRTSIIALILAISIYSWKQFRKKLFNKLKCLFLIIVGSILFMILLSNLNKKCFNEFNTLRKSITQELQNKKPGASLDCRLNYIKHSTKLIKEYPILGVGTGDSLYASKLLIGENKYKVLVTKPCNLGKHNQIFYFDNHNMYLTMLMLFGPLGLIIFFYLFYTIYLIGKKYNSLELILATIMVLIISIPITIFYTSVNFILFFSIYIPLIYLNNKYKLI